MRTSAFTFSETTFARKPGPLTIIEENIVCTLSLSAKKNIFIDRFSRIDVLTKHYLQDYSLLLHSAIFRIFRVEK